MKISLKGKGIIKKIALALAGVAAITAVGFGVKAIVDYTKNDLKTVYLSYDVGNLGADGKFVDDESTLYTKEAFGCYGLQVKPDFDSTVNYQIFYYDDLDNFIESTEILSGSYSGGNNDCYARLVIIPTNDEDDKISWTERLSYPKQLEIKVSKNQNFKYLNVLNKRLREVDNVSLMRFVYGDLVLQGDTYIFADSEKTTVTSKDVLAVKGGEKFTFDFSSLTAPEGCHYGFFVYEFRYVNGVCEVVKVTADKSSAEISKSTTHVVLTFLLYNSTEQKAETVSDNLLSSINNFVIISKN